jgi:hypothetical protein
MKIKKSFKYNVVFHNDLGAPGAIFWVKGIVCAWFIVLVVI